MFNRRWRPTSSAKRIPSALAAAAFAALGSKNALATTGYTGLPNPYPYNVSDPVILQDFESSYLSIENKMPDIFESGYGGVYLPPPGYSTTTNSVGYDVYNRFDLGTAQQPTTYGTQNEFESVVGGIHSFGGNVYADLLWNDSGTMNVNTPGFAASGGYPGLAVVLQTTNPSAPGYNTLGYNASGPPSGDKYSYSVNGSTYTYYYYGDFHDPVDGGAVTGQVSGLNDIAQETNYVMIRQPTTAGNPENIPEGTTPWDGYLANVPTPSNAQFYPDLSTTPKVVYDAALNQTFTIYQYNPSAPMSGTAVAENALGYLMRYAQWMLQDEGVDGFRVDAAKNMPTFVMNYLDAAVYDESGRTLLNGQQEQVYSFSEVYDGNSSTVQQYISLNDSNPGSSTVQGNRDALDFPLYFSLLQNLNAFNGAFGAANSNTWNGVNGTSGDGGIINASVDLNDDGEMNGSQGVKFVSEQDLPAPGLWQVAYAYTLMLPGQAIVYFNGQNFNNESANNTQGGEFPQGGAGDEGDSASGALGGPFDTNAQNAGYTNLAITNLVDIRNRYGRGNYREDWVEQNLLAYERTGSAIVMLSNSTTPGYESRSFDVTFAPGTWLEELTGNATSSYADPNGDIPEFIQVQSGGSIAGGGFVNARFLNNGTYTLGGGSTYATNDGFLIYGLPTPTGSAKVSNVSSVMASQTGNSTAPGGFEPNANYSNGVDRNTTVDVVTASSFQISLNTNEALLQVTSTTTYHDQDADGDNALFTIDGGTTTVAANGQTSTTPGTNGEFTAPGTVSYGYQAFANSSPGYSNASGNGAYSQTIDTAGLSIGYHYIEMIAFRHNDNANSPALYNDWYETVYVDRGTPSSAIQSFAPFASAPSTYENRQMIIQGDGTTTSTYVYLNLPSGITNAQILNLVNTGDNTINGTTYLGGSAGEIDQDVFAYGYDNIQNGNNVATVVSYRPDGNYSIQRFTADEVPDLGHSTLNGLGLGDLNEDGHINDNDVYEFYEDVLSNGQAFNPAADMNGEGFNNLTDWQLFGQLLQEYNQFSTSNPYYVSSSTIAYYNELSATVPEPATGTLLCLGLIPSLLRRPRVSRR